MHHPGAATAMVPKSLKFLTRPLIFRAGGGKPFKKIDTWKTFGASEPAFAPPPGGSTFLIGAAAVLERAEAGPEKEGGRGIDKASSSPLGLSPKPKAISR